MPLWQVKRCRTLYRRWIDVSLEIRLASIRARRLGFAACAFQTLRINEPLSLYYNGPQHYEWLTYFHKTENEFKLNT